MIDRRVGEPLLVTRTTEDADARAHAWFSQTTSYTDFHDPIEFTALALREIGLRDSADWGRKRTGSDGRPLEQLQGLLPSAIFADASGIVESCRVVKMRKRSPISDKPLERPRLEWRQGCRPFGPVRRKMRWPRRFSAPAPSPAASTRVCRCSLRLVLERASRSRRGPATHRARRSSFLLEVPGCVRRYGAALMRSAVVAPVSAELERMADVSRQALESMMRAIRPGRPLGEVWQVWANVLAKAGFFHRRRTGYSIGVNFPPDWGEAQILAFSPSEGRLLEPNMTFHIPSNVQVFGKAMMSTSETVLITSSGCELLTSFDRHLAVK